MTEQQDIVQNDQGVTPLWGKKLRAEIAAQKSLSAEKIIARESDRNATRFNALALYLQQNKETLSQRSDLSPETREWVTQGGLDKFSGARLSAIFAHMAQNHNAVMRSDAVICNNLAYNAVKNDKMRQIKTLPHEAAPRKVNFGFVSMVKNADDAQKRLAVTFPVVAVPNKISRVSDLSADHPLVVTLEKLYSLTSHDWLHHLTVSAMTKAYCDYTNDDREVEKWAEKYFANSANIYPVFDFGANETLYEGWALLTNAQIMKTTPEGTLLRDEILITAMQMINHGKAYIEQHQLSEDSMKTAYWFILQTTKALRTIMPVDGFEMRKFIEAAANHLPHPDRYTDLHIEHIKYRLYEGHDAMCMLQSPQLANDELRQKKYQNFRDDNAKITADLVAHLDQITPR